MLRPVLSSPHLEEKYLNLYLHLDHLCRKNETKIMRTEQNSRDRENLHFQRDYYKQCLRAIDGIRASQLVRARCWPEDFEWVEEEEGVRTNKRDGEGGEEVQGVGREKRARVH